MAEKLIWIVDDDPGILEVTEIILQESGFKTKKIADKIMLEKELTTALPELILLDVTVAGVNGAELAKELKNDQKTAHIPVILMSADAFIEEKAKHAGVDDILKKPFDIHYLEQIVKKYTS
jgi:CheY-like chemotaxis protein